MKILSGEQMARWDRLSIQKHGISARNLMERAARECCRALSLLRGWVYQARVLIVSGPGNNGGDGLAMAAMLRAKGVRVALFFTGDVPKLSPEARFFLDQADGNWFPLKQAKDLAKLKRESKQADFIVDALFGIGLKRPLKGIYAKIIAVLNEARAFRFAVDIPSGIDATSGKILGTAFSADLTVTFEVPKWGQLLPEAWDKVGKLHVVSIGLSRSELKKFQSQGEWVDLEMIRPWIPQRSKRAHKGDAGKVLVIAGSDRMPGAGYLSALSALRSGAGLVSWALPEEAFHKIDLHYPEVILHPVPSRNGAFFEGSLKSLRKILPHFQAVAVGPGLGESEATQGFLKKLLSLISKPLVLDADALNALAKMKALPKKISGSIWTPHPKEMARLCGVSPREILADRIGQAKKLSRKRKVWILLKGYRSVIAGPNGELFINSTGEPNLATAGSGDVLTGIIAGLAAQGLSRKQALLSGVFLHGLAGDSLAERYGERGTIASDIVGAIPEVLRKLS